MKNRSKGDIVTQILEVTKDGPSKTQIMYRAFLSNYQAKQYMRMLIDSGLIAQDIPSKSYKTTEKGLQVLALYGRLNQLAVVNNLSVGNPLLPKIK